MSFSLLVELSPIVTLFGFMIRDQLYLRLFIMIEPLLMILFFAFVDQNSPGQAAASLSIFVVNMVMVFLIWHERTHYTLTGDQRALLDYLRDLTPGEFRRLMKITDWLDIEYETELTTLGTPNRALFFVLEGHVRVERDDKTFIVGNNRFIGELGLVLDQPASATTKATKGSKVVRWKVDEYVQFMERHPNIKIIFDRFINQDLASKLAHDKALLPKQSSNSNTE